MKCDRDACPNQALKGDRYCKDATCLRAREALAKRAAQQAATPKRETGPIVSRDEEAAKAASKSRAPEPPDEDEPLDDPWEPSLNGDEDDEDEKPKGKPGPKPGQTKGQPRQRDFRGRYWQAVIELELKLLEEAVAAGNRRMDLAAKWLGVSKLGLKGLIKRTGFDADRLKMSQEEKAARLQAHMERRTLEKLIAKTTSPKAKQALEEALAALEAA
jgi:hypothetical protein